MPDNEIFTAAVIPEEALDPVSVPIGIFEYSKGSIVAPYVQVKTGRDFVVIDDLYVEGNIDITGSLTVSGSTILSGIKTVTSSSNALDVTGISIIYCNTTAGDIIIGGFAGGVQGQTININKHPSANNLVLGHLKALGTQKILTRDAADITFTTYGSVDLVYVYNYWRPKGY